MKVNNYFVLYALKKSLNSSNIYRKFVAIDQITDKNPYEIDSFFRLKTKFNHNIQEISLQNISNKLPFISKKFRFGCFKMTDDKFNIIYSAMKK